ncbi:MAG: hypothetical protein ACLFOC_03845 [Campylobacterales bacterium]
MKKRWFQNRKIVGEIIADVGLGLLVNGMYTVFTNGFSLVDSIIILISISIIAIGATNKYKED